MVLLLLFELLDDGAAEELLVGSELFVVARSMPPVPRCEHGSGWES